jgi:hypothetical protein
MASAAAIIETPVHKAVLKMFAEYDLRDLNKKTGAAKRLSSETAPTITPLGLVLAKRSFLSEYAACLYKSGDNVGGMSMLVSQARMGLDGIIEKILAGQPEAIAAYEEAARQVEVGL